MCKYFPVPIDNGSGKSLTDLPLPLHVKKYFPDHVHPISAIPCRPRPGSLRQILPSHQNCA